MVFVAAHVHFHNISQAPEVADGLPQNGMWFVFSFFDLKTNPYNIVTIYMFNVTLTGVPDQRSESRFHET